MCLEQCFGLAAGVSVGLGMTLSAPPLVSVCMQSQATVEEQLIVGVMRTKAELAELANANGNGSEQDHIASHSFLTEHQRAALDAALAAKQTAPSELIFLEHHAP